MARIAEDLLLLLLDNPSAQPGLNRARLRQVLSGAVLLDLACATHLRPAGPGDSVPDGQLIALASAVPVDAVSLPALQLVRQRPLPVQVALSKLGRGTESGLIAALEQSRQLRRVDVGPIWRRNVTYPLTDRSRVGQARAALMAALFDRQPPTPATAGIVTLLHAIDGLGSVLSLNDRGWRWVHARSAEIAGGGWVHESPTGVAELNLAVTASALRSALS
ncbi:MAG: GPP34 family phosphoprotein [Mycobacterium sp.]